MKFIKSLVVLSLRIALTLISAPGPGGVVEFMSVTEALAMPKSEDVVIVAGGYSFNVSTWFGGFFGNIASTYKVNPSLVLAEALINAELSVLLPLLKL